MTYACCRRGATMLTPAFLATVTLVAIVSGCLSPNAPLPAGTDTSVDCATSTLRYDNFGKPYFQKYCIRCHSVALEDDRSRLDAPIGIDFDTLNSARDFLDRIRLRSGELGDMPPRLLGGPFPSDAERVQLIQWIDCGMP